MRSVRADVDLQPFRFRDDVAIRTDDPAKLELGKIDEIMAVLDTDASRGQVLRQRSARADRPS